MSDSIFPPATRAAFAAAYPARPVKLNHTLLEHPLLTLAAQTDEAGVLYQLQAAADSRAESIVLDFMREHSRHGQDFGATGIAEAGIIAAVHEHQARGWRQDGVNAAGRQTAGKGFTGQSPQGRVFPALEFVVRKSGVQRLRQCVFPPGLYLPLACRRPRGEQRALAVEESRHQAAPACTLA